MSATIAVGETPCFLRRDRFGNEVDETDRPLSERVTADFLRTKLAEKRHGSSQPAMAVDLVASEAEQEEFLNVFFNEDEDELLAADAEEPEYIEVDVVGDSGAGDNVASRQGAPGCNVRESAGSRKGQNFVSASRTRIKNEGEMTLEMQAPTDKDGEFNPVNAVFQVADVCRPLMSISRICDRGDNKVTFDKQKAVVRNSKGQIVMVFHRKGNLYVGRMRVKNPKYKGFGRQGS